ncbi:MAG: hypothetical protein JSV03_06310, partial [Planctomycetota bacterium]
MSWRMIGMILLVIPLILGALCVPLPWLVDYNNESVVHIEFVNESAGYFVSPSLKVCPQGMT